MRTIEDMLYERLCKIPLMDIHTHIDAFHIAARHIGDVALYHMLISDLYSAGCPDGSRLSEDPDDEEIAYRMDRAAPYYKYIKNTCCYWGLKIILTELYGWEQDITAGNWRELDGIIRKKAADPNWGKEILRRAGIRRTVTELWRGHDHIADDIFQYSLEWAFFTRCQWGQFDTALLELEYAWNQDRPGMPLPVTVDRSSLNLKKSITTLDDVHNAISHYCARIPLNEIISIASHLSTDITYREVTHDEMVKALANRERAGEWERDVYANYITGIYFDELKRINCRLSLLFSVGAEPLPYETGSKLSSKTVFELASLFSKYETLDFCMFLADANYNQSFCTLARELPNVSMGGYWWHNFFPAYMRDIMSQRLDMLAVNRQFGFFTDAYNADWTYAKSFIIRRQLANVLTLKVGQGQYSIDDAVEIARGILYDTAVEKLGMKP